MIQHYFALAIPKTPGHTHWAQTDWGRQIWDEGNRAHPNFAPHATFSWKIEDGDSAVLYVAGHGVKLGGRYYVVPADGTAAPRNLTPGEFEHGNPAWLPDSTAIVTSSQRQAMVASGGARTQAGGA
jgi:hypothetical protein